MPLPRSKHSRTSLKRLPKIQKLSGRLREVLVFKNQTTQGLFRKEVGAHLLFMRWLFTRIKPQGASSEKKSGHIYFMEDNLLYVMSKLRHV